MVAKLIQIVVAARTSLVNGKLSFWANCRQAGHWPQTRLEPSKRTSGPSGSRGSTSGLPILEDVKKSLLNNSFFGEASDASSAFR